MTDNLQKAFDFAQETTKQLITLATGILALTLTFLKDVASSAPAGTRIFLEWGWGIYLVSILFGVGALMTLSGNLERPGSKTTPTVGTPSIYRLNIRFCVVAQSVLFLVATSSTVIFGIKAI